jgi:hypothetical protein
MEEEFMHTQCQCLMKASFMLDVDLVIETLKTKPLSPSLGSSKSIFGYDGKEKYKGSITLRQQFCWLSYQSSGKGMMVFRFKVFHMVNDCHYSLQ